MVLWQTPRESRSPPGSKPRRPAASPLRAFFDSRSADQPRAVAALLPRGELLPSTVCLWRARSAPCRRGRAPARGLPAPRPRGSVLELGGRRRLVAGPCRGVGLPPSLLGRVRVDESGECGAIPSVQSAAPGRSPSFRGPLQRARPGWVFPHPCWSRVPSPECGAWTSGLRCSVGAGSADRRFPAVLSRRSVRVSPSADCRCARGAAAADRFGRWPGVRSRRVDGHPVRLGGGGDLMVRAGVPRQAEEACGTSFIQGCSERRARGGVFLCRRRGVCFPHPVSVSARDRHRVVRVGGERGAGAAASRGARSCCPGPGHRVTPELRPRRRPAAGGRAAGGRARAVLIPAASSDGERLPSAGASA